MSGGPRVRSMNLADSDERPVLVPGGNKARTVDAQKPAAKPHRKVERLPEMEANSKDKRQAQVSPTISPPMKNLSASAILRQHGNQLLRGNLSMNASCSSDASSDSCHSRASTGRISRSSSLTIRRKQGASKLDKVVNKLERMVDKVVAEDGVMTEPDGSAFKRRCAWVTSNTGICFCSAFYVGSFLFIICRPYIGVVRFGVISLIQYSVVAYRFIFICPIGNGCHYIGNSSHYMATFSLSNYPCHYMTSSILSDAHNLNPASDYKEANLLDPRITK